MTRSRRLTLALAILLPPLLLLAALGYLLSDPGLNAVVRPRLERFAGERLQAEVRLERLALRKGHLEISGISVISPEKRLIAKRLEADFLLSELFARRLAALRVTAPEMEIAAGDEQGDGLPESPPLRIGRVEIVGGSLTLHAAGRSWRMEEIHLQGGLDEVSPFYLSSRIDDIPLAAHGRFAWGETPSLVLDSAKLDEEELLASPLRVTLPAEGAAAGGALGIERLDDTQLGRILTVFGVDSPVPPDGWFALEEIRLTFDWRDGQFRGALTAQSFRGGVGDVDIAARELRLKGGRTGEGWSGEGDLLLAGVAPFRFAGRLAGDDARGSFALSAADPATLLEQIAGGEWPRVAGGIDVRGEVRATSAGVRVEAALEGTPGKGGRDLPDLSSYSADVLLDVRGGELAAKGRLLRSGREIVHAAGDLRQVTVELLPTDLRDLASILPAQMRERLPQGGEGIAGSAVLQRDGDDWRGQLAVTAKRLPLPPVLLEEVRLQGRFSRHEETTRLRQGTFSGRLSGDDLPSARLSAEGAAEVTGDDFRVAFERFAAEGVEFIAADGMTGVSGAQVKGRGELAGRLGGAARLDLTADLNAGEVLRGAFYADLSSLPASVRVQGGYEPRAESLRVQRLTLTLPEVGMAHFGGSLSPSRIDLDGTVEIDLDRGWERLRRTLGESLPVMTEIRPQGGLAIEAALRRDEKGWRLRGVAEPRRLGLRWDAARLHLAGLSGSLPFDLGTAPPEGGERRGRLAFEHFAYRMVELRGEEIRLLSAPGRFALGDPLVFAVAGGELEIADPAAEFSGGAPDVNAVLRVRGVDLEELTRELGVVEMTGGLSADLGRIRYRRGTLTTDGEMRIEAFGGEMRVRNLRLDSLFTSYSTSSADVEFSGIDLRRLTATLAFGEVNGVADGYIRGLRLFGAVPSHFEASFETRTEGRRNISVKALQNFTTISQGGLSAVLSRGIYRFIDFYRYRKIGLYCTLRNDVFVLTGTAREGTDRYLVDGGFWPPKINIIAPEHAISFKEMVNRLQRIDRTGGAGEN